MEQKAGKLNAQIKENNVRWGTKTEWRLEQEKNRLGQKVIWFWFSDSSHIMIIIIVIIMCTF